MATKSDLSSKRYGLIEVQGEPLLKWVGGKRQLLPVLLPKVPLRFGRYIEPFFGGGALFFALQPEQAIISDSNPELINVYEQVAWNLHEVINHLNKYENTLECFYEVRALDWEILPPPEAAARFIFLNRTCFNGLYRVNQQGQFNVPFGNYKNPKFNHLPRLMAASNALQHAKIECGSYDEILAKHAQRGDFIFLDPPYYSELVNANFKRYTKDVFGKDDHVKLAEVVKELYNKGCYVILTNSNDEIVHELFSDFKIEVIPTRRNVSCRASTRTGEDIVVTAFPKLAI